MNMKYESLHEVAAVRFLAKEQRPLAELSACLFGLGFICHEDVFSLDRTDKVLPWQHGSIAEVHAYLGDQEVYGNEGLWDLLLVEYLFSFLPRFLIEQFIDMVFQVGDCLQLAPTINGIQIEQDEIRRIFDSYIADLFHECADEPGSEAVAILISETYPRRY